MGAFVDITGNRYGRLIVLRRLENKNGRMRWLCQCDCGEQTECRGEHLKTLKIRSCGCLDMERMTTHGKSRTREYRIWTGMKMRCHNPNEPHYADYGGRGITVCLRWRESFKQFYADMGPKPTGRYSVNRIQNDFGYGPMNCNWATDMEQVNNRRNTRRATINGVTKLVKEWCVELGVPYQVALKRMKRGIPPEIAVTAKGHSLRGTQYHADSVTGQPTG